MHITDLGEQLSSSDPPTRHNAAKLLSQNADAAVDVAIELVQFAGDPDRVVAEYCVATLEELGPPAASQLEPLSQLAVSENSDVAYWAVTLIGRAGVAATNQAMLLGDIVIGDAELAVRERAAWALSRIGSAASVAVPQLQSVSEDQPDSLVRAVAKALETIEG